MCLDLICRRTTRCTQDGGHYLLLYCKLGKSCSALLIHLWHSKTWEQIWDPWLLAFTFAYQISNPSVKNFNPVLLPQNECSLMPQGERSSFQGLNGGAEPSGTFHIPTTCIIGIIFILVQVSKSMLFSMTVQWPKKTAASMQSIHCIHWVSVLSGWTAEYIEWVS